MHGLTSERPKLLLRVYKLFNQIDVNVLYWFLIVFSFIGIFCFEVLLAKHLDTTWEWDAVYRGWQGYEIFKRGIFGKGLQWYFFDEPHAVWLPFWQILVAFGHLVDDQLGWQTQSIGVSNVISVLISALSTAFTSLYVFVFIRRMNFNRLECALAIFLPLTSGFCAAYGSQGMTDVFSSLLLFATIYYFLLYLETHSRRYAVCLSIVAFLNVATRYEAWLFTLIFAVIGVFITEWGHKLDFVKILKTIVVFVPAGVFVILWLLYNHLAFGNPFYFDSWIRADVLKTAPMWYPNRNPMWNPYETISLVFQDLFLSNGVFWLTIFLQHFTIPRKGCDAFKKVSTTLFVVYLLYFACSVYTGGNAGWARHLLYFVPVSTVTLMNSTRNMKKLRYLLIFINLLFGLFAFSWNLAMKESATNVPK